MNKLTTDNYPIYSFLKFGLKSIDFNQAKQDKRFLEDFGISASNIDMHDNGASFDVTITLSGPSFNGVCIFTCVFVINDNSWISSLKGGQFEAVSNMFCLVFPFLRQTICSLTNDSLGQIILPTLDLRNVNICSGVRFARKKPNISSSGEKPHNGK